MSKEHPSSELQMVPIDRIEVLNPRERNNKVFEEIIGNIKSIGLKKPVTVTPRKESDGQEKFLLICGEGRLKAFKSLGETTIPAMVVHVTNEDAFIMSLAENIARRQGRTLELLAGIEHLRRSRWSSERSALFSQYWRCDPQDEANPADRMRGIDGGDQQHHRCVCAGTSCCDTLHHAGGRSEAQEVGGCHFRADGKDGTRDGKPARAVQVHRTVLRSGCAEFGSG